MPKPSSLSEVASILGVHRNTVAEWLKAGCPFVTQASRDEGVEWRLDVAAVHKWRVEQSVKDALAGYAHAQGGVTKDEADRRRAVAMAITAEVDASQALKNVVSRHDAEEAMADFCQALRSSLDNVGAKIAGRAAIMTNPNEIREFSEAEINRAFRAAEADLTERWADGLDPKDADG